MAKDSIFSRLSRAWNVFRNRDPDTGYRLSEESFTYRVDRPRLTRGRERTIVNAVFNRIALDVSDYGIVHVRMDENNRFKEEIDSDLNWCLTTEANLDQSGREFIQDIVISMLDEGVVAGVPIERKVRTGDISSIRTAKILQWSASRIQVHVYNELTGKHEDVWVSKRETAIFNSPFYSVINEPNSTLSRLIRKLTILDSIDEQVGSGKLDLIIQLPFAVKSPMQKARADDRRKDIEDQLKGSRYGIAYIDSTEHVTQLNRPLENNLLSTVQFLTDEFYAEIGFSKTILDGTADEQTMRNYNNRLIRPCLRTIAEEMKRKFLSKTAITQRQSIWFYSDPFSLVPVAQLADIADKFTRNEIMSSNEVRQAIGMKPSSDPSADELRNKNISQAKEDVQPPATVGQEEEEENQNEV